MVAQFGDLGRGGVGLVLAHGDGFALRVNLVAQSGDALHLEALLLVDVVHVLRALDKILWPRRDDEVERRAPARRAVHLRSRTVELDLRDFEFRLTLEELCLRGFELRRQPRGVGLEWGQLGHDRRDLGIELSDPCVDRSLPIADLLQRLTGRRFLRTGLEDLLTELLLLVGIRRLRARLRTRGPHAQRERECSDEGGAQERAADSDRKANQAETAHESDQAKQHEQHWQHRGFRCSHIVGRAISECGRFVRFTRIEAAFPAREAAQGRHTLRNRRRPMTEPRRPISTPRPRTMNEIFVAVGARDVEGSEESVRAVEPRVEADLERPHDTDAQDRADQPLHEALGHERHPHEPVRGADELHDLDLAATGERGQADRVDDQEQRRHQQHDRQSDEDQPGGVGGAEQTAQGFLGRLDRVDAGKGFKARLDRFGELRFLRHDPEGCGQRLRVDVLHEVGILLEDPLELLVRVRPWSRTGSP